MKLISPQKSLEFCQTSNNLPFQLLATGKTMPKTFSIWVKKAKCWSLKLICAARRPTVRHFKATIFETLIHIEVTSASSRREICLDSNSLKVSKSHQKVKASKLLDYLWKALKKPKLSSILLIYVRKLLTASLKKPSARSKTKFCSIFGPSLSENRWWNSRLSLHFLERTGMTLAALGSIMTKQWSQ